MCSQPATETAKYAPHGDEPTVDHVLADLAPGRDRSTHSSNFGRYPSIIRSRMRKSVAGSQHAAEVDGLIAELRETHRRRPRLQQEFDRAGLP